MNSTHFLYKPHHGHLCISQELLQHHSSEDIMEFSVPRDKKRAPYEIGESFVTQNLCSRCLLLQIQLIMGLYLFYGATDN